MKILQITYSGFGGASSVAFALISADHTRSHDWSIAFIGDVSLEPSYQRLCEDNQICYAAFRSTPGRPYLAWIHLAVWLAKVKPAVVICHTNTTVLACRWYASRWGARLIVVEHTTNSVKSLSERLASRVSMLVADQVVVLTAEYRKELHEALGLLFRPSKVRVIPNGIDTELFTPRLPQRDVWTDRIRLGMAARFSFSKRQDLLVSVMSRLGTLRPDLSFELRFAGDGVELERVKNYASASLYSTHIHFDGLLDEKEVAHWMRNLDVYLQATDGETLSTSLLQAMATGLPIVASAVDGVTNLLGSKGEYGLCAANVVDDFAKAILHIIDSPDLSIAMSSRARQRSLNFNSQVMLASYSKLASEVLE